MVRSDSEPLGPFVQIDEALVGGKGGPHKELVLVAAEANGRVRLAHAENNDEATLQALRRRPDRGRRPRRDRRARRLQREEPRRAAPRARSCRPRPSGARTTRVQGCHWTISLLKRWLLGTHAGAVRDKHLQAYLDEFAFRHNRRKTNGVGRIAARVIESLVARPPLTMRQI